MNGSCKRYEEIREAAIKDGGMEFDYNDNLVETDRTIGFILGAKWADKNPYQWTRPEDRLPNDGDDCIIIIEEFCYDEDENLTDTITERAIYDAEDDVFSYWDYYDDFNKNVSSEDVVAWMLIPKYKG